MRSVDLLTAAWLLLGTHLLAVVVGVLLAWGYVQQRRHFRAPPAAAEPPLRPEEVQALNVAFDAIMAAPTLEAKREAEEAYEDLREHYHARRRTGEGR